jgi:hypothetical protein
LKQIVATGRDRHGMPAGSIDGNRLCFPGARRTKSSRNGQKLQMRRDNDGFLPKSPCRLSYSVV